MGVRGVGSEAAVGRVAHAQPEQRELLVRGEAAVCGHVLQLAHVCGHLDGHVPGRRDGRIEHHQRDLEAAGVGIGVAVDRVARRLEARERERFLPGQIGVRVDRIDERHHRVVLPRELADEQQVQRGGEGGRREEAEGDVHRVEVVRALECLLPLLIRAVEHELRREGHRGDPRADGQHGRHEHGELAIGVREQQRVRDALEQTRRLRRPLVGHEEIGVVHREQAHAAAYLPRVERQLEARQRDGVQVAVVDRLGRAQIGRLVEARPREHVR
mmetsp:Transcript_32092/g.84034  ORF Transcript_32092/g.84034 Transcript_32092/m.84034 type:complete len:272 (+) Transcript_32092:865-1680(+)